MRKLRLLFITLAMLLVTSCSEEIWLGTRSTATPVPPTETATPKPSPVGTLSTIDCNSKLLGGKKPSALPKLSIVDLYRCRSEARSVVSAIKKNGPFAFSRDDIVFENREGILPAAKSGSGYREYTVITLGISDRGERRIITYGPTARQPSGYTQMYYTDDHYLSFWLIIE